MKTLAHSKSRFGPPINIEEELRTGAIAYWQGEYYQSRADRGGVSLLTTSMPCSDCWRSNIPKPC